MNKIPSISQNTEAKTLPADVCVFGHIGRLSSAAVHSADCQFDSRVKWWIHVSFIFMQKLLFFVLKQRSEISTHCCFWSTVSKRGTHFEHSFLIDKCSCKMVNTMPSDIFNSSAILCFNLQLAKTNLWSFLVFSGTNAEFGQSKHLASFVFVQPHLRSVYHLLTIVSNGADSE